MTRILLAACALGALSAATQAQAQSSMTIFGSVDVNYTRARVGDERKTVMDQGGNKLPSRIGFRGTEDLGGGLSAGFWLEAAIIPQTGAVSSTFFGRRSTLSLASRDWGELRMGRDYVATFWNISNFTPFGTVGVGGSSNIIEGWPNGIGGARTMTRANNALGYFLPRNALGIYGQLTYATPDGVDGAKYTGARLGYASGPVDIAAAYGRTPAGATTYKVWTVGGTYEWTAVKLFLNYFRQERLDDQQSNISVGVSLPTGPGRIQAPTPCRTARATASTATTPGWPRSATSMR